MDKKFNGFHLKLIAIIGMLINHMGIVFQWSHNTQTLPLYAISEFVGKFTFPIMAYLLVEGFHYSHNKIRYAGRLALFWLISIYPFFLLRAPDYNFGLTDLTNNIFFTLLMGLIMLMCYEKTKSPILHFIIVVLFAFLTIMSDWNLVGVILIWAFYKFNSKKGIRNIILIYFILFEILIGVSIVINGSNLILALADLIPNLGFLAVGYLLLNYDGTRGYSPNWIKWGFYIFYPLHLIILEIIKYLFFS